MYGLSSTILLFAHESRIHNTERICSLTQASDPLRGFLFHLDTQRMLYDPCSRSLKHVLRRRPTNRDEVPDIYGMILNVRLCEGRNTCGCLTVNVPAERFRNTVGHVTSSRRPISSSTCLSLSLSLLNLLTFSPPTAPTSTRCSGRFRPSIGAIRREPA